MTTSFNAEAGQLYLDDPDQFCSQSLEAAKESRVAFNSLPKDCPYRFKKVRKIPPQVTEILKNKEVRTWIFGIQYIGMLEREIL